MSEEMASSSFQSATRAQGATVDKPTSVVLEGVAISHTGKATIKKYSAIIVTCCDLETIFEVEVTPPLEGDISELVQNTWIRIAKTAAFQCPKCQEWTLVEPMAPDGRLGVTKVKSFTPEISLLLRLLLELGGCIVRSGPVGVSGGCGECPFCLLKAKFKG